MRQPRFFNVRKTSCWRFAKNMHNRRDAHDTPAGASYQQCPDLVTYIADATTLTQRPHLPTFLAGFARCAHGRHRHEGVNGERTSQCCGYHGAPHHDIPVPCDSAGYAKADPDRR